MQMDSIDPNQLATIATYIVTAGCYAVCLVIMCIPDNQ